jgi:arylsulfatase A-like enzyme
MKPQRNILYIHSHDTGRWIQPYGFAVQTPNLMQLAERGTLFRKAFCAGPTCSPSRAALLTGEYPHNTGMLGLVNRGHHLNHPQRHLNHTLKQAGYQTLLAGIQHIATGDDIALLGYDHILPTVSNRAKDVADAAVEGLQQRDRTQPFFMSVGLFETHRMPCGDFGHPIDATSIDYIAPAAPLCDTPQTREDMASFHASVHAMDHAIGRILRTLDEQHLTDNTLIVYTTDHGPAFPRMKANLTDMGIGVSLIMAGPDGFDQGGVLDSMVTHLDLYPTFCDYLGIEPPHWLVGKSLRPLVVGQVSQLHETIFAQVNYHGAYDPLRCLRTERYKFIKRFENRQLPTLRNCDPGLTRDYWLDHNWASQHDPMVQLYDLVFDPYESNNLAARQEFSAMVQTFDTQLTQWMQQHQDPLLQDAMPTPNGVIPDPAHAPVQVNLPQPVNCTRV